MAGHGDISLGIRIDVQHVNGGTVPVGSLSPLAAVKADTDIGSARVLLGPRGRARPQVRWHVVRAEIHGLSDYRWRRRLPRRSQ